MAVIKRKKVLFVIPSLASGGAEKSLVNLLKVINYDKYDVDLFLIYHQGQFMHDVHEKVRILPASELLIIFTMSFFKSMFLLLKRRKFILAFNRSLVVITSRLLRNIRTIEFLYWKNISGAMPTFTTEYDVAIGYLEGISNYFVIDKVKARIKIGWIHNDYKGHVKNKLIDNYYFSRLDAIVTVSKECANILKKVFPRYLDKIKVIHNIILPSVIKELAGLRSPFKNNKINLVTVGRLSWEKGYDLAVPACRMLLDSGYDIMWYILGEGYLRKEIIKMIKKFRLESFFILLGAKGNPYPYVAHCQIYVQPSKCEGRSIAIEEAKILHKPIVTTNFVTVYDQIKDNFNGLISEMSPKDIFTKVKYLIDNKEFSNSLSCNLMAENFDNSYEINKLYEIMENKS